MVQDDEKISRGTPAATVASSSTRPAVTLLARYFAGSATDSATRANAARCMTASIRWPANSRSTTTLPMYPAPPVTRMLRAIRPLQVEQPLERFEQAVAPARLGRFLERDGGRMQELVEQRLTEVLDLAAILGTEMRQPAQRSEEHTSE